jgi:hypothetical protein
VICSIASPIAILIVKINSITSLPNSNSSPEVGCLFTLVLGLELVQFDPQLSNYIPVICWEQMMVTVKKKALPPFISVNALLFSMQYGHASFPCMLQPETIL